MFPDPTVWGPTKYQGESTDSRDPAEVNSLNTANFEGPTGPAGRGRGGFLRGRGGLLFGGGGHNPFGGGRMGCIDCVNRGAYCRHCFFCGDEGHDCTKCPKMEEAEQKNGMGNQG